jgi:hypothetical protein
MCCLLRCMGPVMARLGRPAMSAFPPLASASVRVPADAGVAVMPESVRYPQPHPHNAPGGPPTGSHWPGNVRFSDFGPRDDLEAHSGMFAGNAANRHAMKPSHRRSKTATLRSGSGFADGRSTPPRRS